MFSKFSVLTNIFKYSKQNGLRIIMIKRKCFTKYPTNLLLIPQETNNIVSIPKDSIIQVSRNMGYSNNKGDGQQTDNSTKIKNLIQKRKKKILRRRSKVKSVITNQKKFKLCKTNKQPETNTEKLISEITLRSKDLRSEKGTLKMDNREVPNNNPGILQSNLPPKKLHVEFMESQNLKDFNLNKSPSSELIQKTNNTIIDIKIKPITSTFLNDQMPSNAKSIDVDNKNSIQNLETQNLTKSNVDYQNKKYLKTEKKDLLKANQIERSYNLKPDLKNNEIKLYDKAQDPMNDSTLESKMKPLRNIDTNLSKISTTKRDLDSGKVKIQSVVTEDTIYIKNNQPSLNSKVNYSKSIANSTEEFTKRADLDNNPINPKLEVSKNPNTSKVKNISGCIHKIILSDSGNEKSKNSLKKSFCPKNMFGEYAAADKLKDVRAIAVNTALKGSRPSPKNSNNKKLGTLKTNKLTKSKRISRGANHGGGLGGDGGDKTNINKETSTATKARPSRFWRTISLTILPLILGLTVYTIGNIGAAEMFKRMSNENSSNDPLSTKILPTFYGKKSKNE